MNWSINEEELLQKLHTELLTIASYNRCKIKIYSKISSRFNLPIIMFSAFNSFCALGLQNFLEQNVISILNAIVSLVVGILSSVYLYMKVGDKINTATLVNHEILELTTKIFKELSLSRDRRTSSGKEFVGECFMEYSKIMQRQSIIKRHIQHHLIFENEDEISITIDSPKSSKIKPTEEKDSLTDDDIPKVLSVD